MPGDGDGWFPPYSVVCRNRHVLVEDLAEEPLLDDNERRRCSEPGCSAPVYSHCRACNTPLPGWMDGIRAEGRITVGKIDRFGPTRAFHTSCPGCSSPYPWATERELADYHREYLKDRERAVTSPLPHNPDAEAAHKTRAERSAKKAESQRKATKAAAKAQRRHVSAARATNLKLWAAGIVAVLGAVTGVFVLWDDIDDRIRGENPTTPSEDPTLDQTENVDE